MIPSDPNQRQKIEKVLVEISNSMTRIEAERSYINEALSNIQEEYEIPKKYMRKVAKIYHKRNLSEVKEEFSSVEDIYDAIVKEDN